MSSEQSPEPDVDMHPWDGEKIPGSIRAEMVVEAVEDVETLKREVGDVAINAPVFIVDGNCLVMAVLNEDGTTLVLEATIDHGAILGLKVPTP